MNKQLILSLTLLLSTPVAQVAAMDSRTPLQATCAICDDSPESVALSCGHKYCNDCLNEIVNLARKEQNLSFLKCPNPSCKANLTEQDIRTITKNNRLVLEKFAQIAAKAWMNSQATNVKQCPTPDCSFAFINELGANQADVTCPSCHKTYCSNCLINHDHSLNCEEAKNISSGKVNADEAWKRANTKPCPKCAAPVEKDGGCQHMKCTRCNYHFCWTCLGHWTFLGFNTHVNFYSCPFKEVNPLPSSSSSRRRIAQAPIQLPDFGPRAHTSTTAAVEATQRTQFLDAVYHGHTQTVETLLAEGADKDMLLAEVVDENEADIVDITPLFIAVQNGHTHIVEMLLAAGADINKALNNGATPLYIAAQNGHTHIVEMLLAAGADSATSLFIAINNGNTHLVEMLLTAGADKDSADNYGATPLFIAAQEGRNQLVQILLAAGADKDKADNYGATPLFIAAQEGHNQIVQTLLAAGADKDKADNYGATPLFIAAQEGHNQIVQMLLTAKVDTSCTYLNKTALDIAREKGHEMIVALLESVQAPSAQPVRSLSSVASTTLSTASAATTISTASPPETTIIHSQPLFVSLKNWIRYHPFKSASIIGMAAASAWTAWKYKGKYGVAAQWLASKLTKK